MYTRMHTHTHTHTCTHTHTTEIHDAFALFDKRGDNKIDATQIGDIMRALGLNPTEAELKKIVKEVDPNSKHTQALCTSMHVKTSSPQYRKSLE